MSLILTSCTMGKQPDRLLNKGPQYLRTRTNSGIFAQRRPSAVELLAASKAQFYTIKSSVDLDKQQDLAVSAGQNERYSKCIKKAKKKEQSRSKSQHDLSQLQHITEDESDENNNDISDDSVTSSKDDIEDSHLVSLQETTTVKHFATPEQESETSLICQSSLPKADALNSSLILSSSVYSPVTKASDPRPTLFHSRISAACVDESVQELVKSKPQTLKDEIDSVSVTKPVPLPRKPKEKPVPLPRKHSLRTSVSEPAQISNLSFIETDRVALHNPVISRIDLTHETVKYKFQSRLCADVRSEHPVGESPTQSFTTLSAKSPLSESEKPLQSPAEVRHSDFNLETACTSLSDFVSKADVCSQKVQTKQGCTREDAAGSCLTPPADRFLDASCGNSDDIGTIKDRKRYPGVVVSARAIKRERASAGPYVSDPKPISSVSSLISTFITLDQSSSLASSKLEMSIESVDQAVCESEISAIPIVSMEGSIMQEVEQEAREITRSNSSLSGKIEQQSTSPLSVSPTPYCSSVPRSYSDISCHLEGQHSRDSSIVSNHSRLSRASIGTDLEKFFNQMGLEKGILEPINRLKELKTNEAFDSMSSLDSHDAGSICSTYSRSEQEWSDSQSTDRSQQQTSIVERNARIIKWLCNVRKAKTQPQSSECTAAGNA